MFIKTYIHVKVFEDLAAIHLCSRHEKHKSQATEQWLDEFNTERASIISRLEDYYNMESDDLYTEDEIEEDDETEESILVYDSRVLQYDSGQKEPDEEPDALEEKVDASIGSSQSSPLPGVIRRAWTIQDDEVSKDVTWLLEQPVQGNSKIPGWVYIISPPNLPGILKVGYAKTPPYLNRFGDHKKCHGEYKVIATKLIPYAYRVEQLLLAEFQNNHYTLKDGCHNCKASHRELLNIDEKSLLRSLKKWIDFVESYPYSKTGTLKPNAKKRLPLPALNSYLGYKGRRPRFSPSPSSGKKGGRQISDSPITPPPRPSFKAATPTTKSVNVDEVELDPDDLCSAMEELQVTPSKDGKRAKGVISGRK
ncbi:hypothetical protein PENSUB_11586 [Penicillium subrubescens]|uniref:Bacteriophage T5 Orf172 DNA-binding domain-containing protein n=2 Tax=Penicillium subrubescens TaxID=1316194 RepID=A0A1Q5T238_9EURO|nr:hypothetical protein PENSUB_11586 [Penicillium subrubescens]